MMNFIPSILLTIATILLQRNFSVFGQMESNVVSVGMRQDASSSNSSMMNTTVPQDEKGALNVNDATVNIFPRPPLSNIEYVYMLVNISGLSLARVLTLVSFYSRCPNTCVMAIDNAFTCRKRRGDSNGCRRYFRDPCNIE